MIEVIKSLDLCIQVVDQMICKLVYADDVVIFANNETDLQYNLWQTKVVNLAKY